jgi:hypothetical protein
MSRLYRTLFAMRSLILASTLMLAAVGASIDRGTAPSASAVHSQLPQQWSVGDPCPPVFTTEPAVPCR